MKKITDQLQKKGQTLVIFLVFIAIAITLTSGAVVVMLTSTSVGDKFEQGIAAMQIAETGGENALLRLLRDPNYGLGVGETLPVGLGTAIIIVSGTSPKTINVTGQYGNFKRKLCIKAGYTNGILVVTPPWTEVTTPCP